jgi:2-oxoisovalerate dehydrogenase E1 component
MRGHEESSGTKYVPTNLFEEWKQKDPLENYEKYLLAGRVLGEIAINNERAKIKSHIEDELAIAFNTPENVTNAAEELAGVYAPKQQASANKTTGINNQPNNLEPIKQAPRFPRFLAEDVLQKPENLPPTKNLRFVDAIQQGLRQSMQLHPNLILMGQDIAEYGGAFKITEGFVQEFGKERVRNTPLCESAIVGAGLGLALEGYKSVMEMQFADFVTVGFNQIVNNLAKLYYRWGQSAGMVIRMPCGGGMGAGPFHSQSNEAWFVHTPGLKVVYPSTPADAKGLLIAAINDPNPVMYFEHKALYRSITGQVPEHYYETEIGKARLVKTGNNVSIIAYGLGVHWAMEYQDEHPDISLYILDLRSLLPLDYEAIKEAVKATGKVLLLHEDTLVGGIGGEISAWVSEHCFEMLDAPIVRCASLDTPIPFQPALEKQFMAKSRLGKAIKRLLAY